MSNEVPSVYNPNLTTLQPGVNGLHAMRPVAVGGPVLGRPTHWGHARPPMPLAPVYAVPVVGAATPMPVHHHKFLVFTLIVFVVVATIVAIGFLIGLFMPDVVEPDE